MPKLHKIETTANYTPAQGSIVVFFAVEDDKLVLKAKKPDGTIETLSGGFDMILGYVDENHKFQPLSFSGTTGTAAGDPETVSTFYTWDTPVESVQDVSANEIYEQLSEI
jgi:hypothetical protein